MNFSSKPKSFVIRNGRVTNSQKAILKDLEQKHVIDKDLLESDFFRSPLVLDIGFGSGETLVHMAEKNRGINFLGVEVYLTGIAKTLKKIESNNLKNVKIFKGDIEDLFLELSEEIKIEAILLFFPDPWPKRRHHKRRLIKPRFLESISRHLLPFGQIYCRTDWKNYASHILDTFSDEKGWEKLGIESLEDYFLDLPVTSFEKKAQIEEREFINLIYRKL
tara:strand:- start:78609 stop:79268 length:660 start_codon:yes stop_codon:yes gene_type:complete